MRGEKIIDYGKLVRAKRREGAHRHDYVYAKGRKGELWCDCGDVFPCRGRCAHFDCILHKVEHGRAVDIPRDFPHGVVLSERVDGDLVVVIDTTAEDPVDWTWPVPP